MSKNNFRRNAKNQVEEILAHWRQVERWIKKAESISKEVPIAAINELRYAGRQLFYALMLLRTQPLDPGKRSSISKRLIITEQYLINADHDVCDAVIAFFAEYLAELDDEFGTTRLTELYSNYPALCAEVRRVSVLSIESRGSAEERLEYYKEIRENHLKSIISAFDDLYDAELRAKAQKSRQEAEIETLILQNKAIEASNVKLKYFNVFAGTASIIGIPLAIYLTAISGNIENTQAGTAIAAPAPQVEGDATSLVDVINEDGAESTSVEESSQ